jgi:ubiquinol-cytochrome c reductase cytochrome b subunit
MIVWRQKHTHFPGGNPPRTEHNIQGERLWPSYAFKSTGLFLVLGAILSLLGGLAQINAVWLYGPYSAHAVSGGSQPDWYVGWLEGTLRLFPNWELHVLGHTIPEVFFPGALLPGIVFAVMYLWPAIERRLTGDREQHNLLNFPRDVPWRTAFGAGALAFFSVLTIAGGNDLIAAFFGVSAESVTRLLQVLVLVLPFVTFALTYHLMRELRRSGAHPVRGSKISVVRRTAAGGFDSTDELAGGGFEATSGRNGAGREARGSRPRG